MIKMPKRNQTLCRRLLLSTSLCSLTKKIYSANIPPHADFNGREVIIGPRSETEIANEFKLVIFYVRNEASSIIPKHRWGNNNRAYFLKKVRAKS